MAKRPDPSTDFKGRFKTKTNWSNGKAHAYHLEIGAKPPVIARVHGNIIFTCDGTGLRAWSSRSSGGDSRAHIHLPGAASCMAVETVNDKINILLGFQDGTFSIYVYGRDDRWEHHSTQATADEKLTAVSLAYPYVMTVAQTQHLSIFQLNPTSNPDTPSPTRMIARLQSGTRFSPTSISLRRAPSGIIAAVAYSFKRLNSGWCLGLQEIRLSSTGLLDSRLVSTVQAADDVDNLRQVDWDMQTRSASSPAVPLHPQFNSPPTSVSYEHPYLVASLADNTLMTFLVTSNNEILEIGSGRRLWGHTSAIAEVDVNKTGKAVSISSRGNEVRVWELETVMTGSQLRTSTQVTAVDALSDVASALARRGSGLGLALHEMNRELELRRRWVGFDEQRVAVLAETPEQRQVMALYDFT